MATPEGPAVQASEIAQPINAPWTGVTVGVREGSTVYWADWTSTGTCTVSGVLSLPSGAIQVTFAGMESLGRADDDRQQLLDARDHVHGRDGDRRAVRAEDHRDQAVDGGVSGNEGSGVARS